MATTEREQEWGELRQRYLAPRETRPASTGQGIHHTALLSSDIERTIRFYDEVLGMPLVELFENRDYEGSTHFFFDVGNGNTVAYFDFPGLDLGDYAEVLGGLHHVAISVTPEDYDAIRGRLEEAGVVEVGPEDVSDSTYFGGPDGERLEIIRNPLKEMYGIAIG
ncbi:MAG: VOC family protein [Actinomycetota bacterium]